MIVNYLEIGEWKNTIEIDIEICERIIFLIMKMPYVTMTYQKLIKNEEREGFVKKKKLRNILKPSPRNYLKIGRGKIP